MPSVNIAGAAWLVLGLAGPAIAQNFRPNQYIIEYASQGNALQARDNLESLGDIRVRKSFDSAVFSGASIETEAFDIDDLVAMPDVANVWRNHIHRLDPIQAAAQGTEFKELDAIVHNSTGVAKLHADGILGEGAMVGVVDTGTWYEHPAVSSPRETLEYRLIVTIAWWLHRTRLQGGRRL
jgi:hypothetical protein